ncbi:MAG: ABC transporter permease [Anaerolineae bacterium]|nr:ABC transporter permease [Anaerolineae bacterium]
MKTLLIARKNLLEMWHEPLIPLLQLLLPLGMLIISWASYSAPLLPTYTIALENKAPAAALILKELAAMTYPDGRPVFKLEQAASAAAALDEVQKHTAHASLNFSQDNQGHLTLNIFGDGAYMPFINASSLLESRLTGMLDKNKGLPEIVLFQTRSLYPGLMKTQFDPLAPGMLIFMILMLGPQAAIYLGREARRGTLQRLRLAPLSAGQILAGFTLAQSAGGILLSVLLLGCMYLLGIHNNGSWLLSILTCLILTFSSIGMGLACACFTRNDFDAYNVTSVFAMLQVFMSGAFFNMPALPLFDLLGHRINLFDFLPASHAMLILRQIFVANAPFSDIAQRLGLMSALCVLYFAAGVWVFRQLKLR